MTVNECLRIDYKDYAEVCFKEFGDRVKRWITFNEPWTFSSSGYAVGFAAPGRCSPWDFGRCSAGDSGREPYIVAHHQLLAHAETVQLYREKYQVTIHPSHSIYATNLGWEPHTCHFLPLSCSFGSRLQLQIKWKFRLTDLINPRVNHLALNGWTT